MIFEAISQLILGYYPQLKAGQFQNLGKLAVYSEQSTCHTVFVILALCTIITVSYLAGHHRLVHYLVSLFKQDGNEPGLFRPELPFLPLDTLTSDPQLQAAARHLDTRLRNLYEGGSVDSLSVAIVGSRGPIFTRGYGFTNPKKLDSDDRKEVDENTIYRVASLTKLFTALKLWMLKEKGAIAWDDDVRKYCPQFSYTPGSWEQYLTKDAKCHSHIEPITLRQIASHFAGIPRDFPPAQLPNWPENMEGTGLPHYHTKDVPLDDKQILDSVSKYPLSNVPNFEPLYSNTGYALLGMACKAAEARLNGIDPANKSFPDLIQRDILKPLGMYSSSFRVNDENKARVAIASTDNEELNVDLKAMNASYGLLSSIADLSKLMQSFLDPTRPESLISPSTLREWLNPAYAWTDELTEVGLLWEIIKISDSFGRRRRVYQKLGEFNGHYSAFAINPSSGFGVIVLMTGSYQDTERIVIEAFDQFQPVFDNLQVKTVTKEYAATWISKDGESEVIIKVANGSLWVHKFHLKGKDILSVLRDDKPEKMALASTGRKREFRLAKGYRPETGWQHWGAIPYWVINSPGHCRGAPVDIVYFSEVSDGLILQVPSAGVSLRRV